MVQKTILKLLFRLVQEVLLRLKIMAEAKYPENDPYLLWNVFHATPVRYIDTESTATNMLVIWNIWQPRLKLQPKFLSHFANDPFFQMISVKFFTVKKHSDI